MALRLARWLRTPEAHEGSFAQLARRYRDEVACVDRARDALAGGDDLAELSDAYARLERAAAARRAAFNRAFGVGPGRLDPQRLGPRRGAPRRGRRWPGPSAGVLDAKVPVLLVVLDGMSWPVAHELLADLRRLHWVEAALPGPGGPPPPVIAAIPSVTEFSRTSLLAGMPHRGKQDDERRLFPVSPRARWPGASGTSRPLLFHKGQLTEGGRGAPAGPVAQAILDAEEPGRRAS